MNEHSRLSRHGHLSRKLALGFIVIGITAAFTVRGAAQTAGLSAQETKLVPSSVAGGDEYGWSVAVSGDTAMAAASRSGAGVVFVFERSAGTWNEVQTLTPSDGVAGQRLGRTLAIEGDTAVLGSFQDPHAGTNSGSAYVFVRTGGSWTEQQKLTASDAAAQDWFGLGVAVSGDTIVVTARGEDDQAVDSGAAYVFVRNGTTWTEQQKLTASDGAASDFLGHDSVGIDQDTIVLGSYNHDSVDTNAGAAYVFVRNGTTWSEQQKLTASDGAANDLFGESVAVEGDVVVVTGRQNDNKLGAAYVFVRNGTTWTEQQKLVGSDSIANDSFGVRTAISEGRILVTSRQAGGGKSGGAYVFVQDPVNEMWTEVARMVGSDVQSLFENFGGSADISSDVVVVGAPAQSARTGAAYAYELKGEGGSACTQDSDCGSAFCVDGVCCDSTCGGGQQGDCQACSVAAGSSTDGTCELLGTDHECRAASSACDQAETCDGLAATCPADVPFADGTTCPDGQCLSGACVPVSDAGLADGGSSLGDGGMPGSDSGAGPESDGGSAPPETSDDGCGCSAGPAGKAGGFATAILLILGFALLRRRRRQLS